MSIENEPNSSSTLQRVPEMESSFSPDRMSAQTATIEDALRQASQEINTAQNSNQDSASNDQEDDFEHVDKPQDETGAQEPNKQHDAKLQSEIQPSKDTEHEQPFSKSKSPTSHDDSEREPHEEKQPLTLRADSKGVPHDAESQTLNFRDERVSSYEGLQVPDLNDNPSPDSNADCSGFTSNKIFLGGILFGAAIMAVGVLIYINFKSPPNNATAVIRHNNIS